MNLGSFLPIPDRDHGPRQTSPYSPRITLPKRIIGLQIAFSRVDQLDGMHIAHAIRDENVVMGQRLDRAASSATIWLRRVTRCWNVTCGINHKYAVLQGELLK